MPIDPSIALGFQPTNLGIMSPLQAQQNALTVQDLMAQAKLRQMQVAQGQQTLANQQYLSQLAQNPANIDPLSGGFRPELIRGPIAQRSPELAQSLMATRQEWEGKNQELLKKKADQTKIETETAIKKQGVIQDTMREPALIAYEEAIKQGKTPEQATSVAQEVYSGGLSELKQSGMFSDDELKRVPGMFDYKRVFTNSQSLKEYRATEQKQKEELRKEKHDEAQAALADKREARADAREARLTNALAQKNAPPGAGYGGEAGKTLTGDEFLKTLPLVRANTVKAIAEGRMSLSDLGVRGKEREALAQAVNQYDPSFDSAQAKARFTAAKDFATGKAGNTVRSLNVSIEHLNTLESAAQALQNGNIQIFNELANRFSAATGSPALTSFEATKKIVADEIVKGIVGGTGGVSDREQTAKAILASSSPAQFAGVVKRYKELLGGQLTGLKQQYERTTQRKDFDDTFLTPESRRELGPPKKTDAGGGAPKKIATDADYNALPSGALFVGPDGKTRRKP